MLQKGLVGKVFVGSIILGITAAGVYIESRVHFGNRAFDLAAANALNDSDDINAIAHTLTSGDITHKYGRTIAKLLGDFNEWMGDIGSIGQNKETQEYNARDRFKDQWNNEVGRRMAEWAEANGYDWNKVYDDLIMDAFKNKKLISKPANLLTSPASVH